MKTIQRSAAVATALMLALCAGTSDARRETLREFLDRKGTIRTFVAQVSNGTPEKGIDTKAIRDGVERALAGRKSHTFAIVTSKEQADIVIAMEIVEFVWTEQDPIDMITGAASAAYDAVMIEHYARMQVRVEITDVKNGRTLWKEKFKSTKTDPKMTREESHGILEKGIVRSLMMQLFKKHNRTNGAF